MNSVLASVADVEACLEQSGVDVRRLHDIWEGRQPVPRPAGKDGAATAVAAERAALAWLQESVELPRLFVRRAIAAGEFLLACDAAREALHLYRRDVELRQLLARALVRVGSVDEARSILRDLVSSAQLTARARAQTLGLLGDISLDDAFAADGDGERDIKLRGALESYRRAVAARPAEIAPALQAGAVASMLGPRYAEEARTLASQVLRSIEQSEADDGPGMASLLARAKALTILGRLEEARDRYRAAAAGAGIALHELGAARKEARVLARGQGQPDSFFDACFPPLQLVVFSGHMLDAPGRTPPRFPAAAEERVRALLRAKLDALDARVGFASAAAGADLIFLEEMLARGGAVHVVLPWLDEAFLNSSVAPYGAVWVERFHRALARATSVRVLGEVYQSSDPVGFEYTNAVMSGLARLTARALDLDLVPLAVWDGLPGAPGGTASFIDLWRGHAVAPEIVSIGGLPTAEAPAPEQAAADAPAGAGGNPAGRASLRQEIKTMLFADIVGYSKLPEHLIPDFVRGFMGLVSRLVAESPHAPISVNTWGDAIYFVFDRAESAGLFALELTGRIATTDWEQMGVYWEEMVDGHPVRRPLSIRTGLHSGPVFMHFDPIVRRLGFTGAHVSRAARIEPVTEPGKVFASEAFAALAALEAAQGFACDFAGTMPLAKKYPGEFRIYRLRAIKSWPLEVLARAIHEDYCRKAIQERWETPATNPSLRAWEDLPADLQASNREQAADIPEKLRAIGYELEPSPGGAGGVTFTPDEIGALARREHDRWSETLRARGWVYAPGPKDLEKKTHECLVPWEELPEVEREKDVDVVRNIPRLLALAGFRVRRSRGG